MTDTRYGGNAGLPGEPSPEEEGRLAFAATGYVGPQDYGPGSYPFRLGAFCDVALSYGLVLRYLCELPAGHDGPHEDGTP